MEFYYRMFVTKKPFCFFLYIVLLSSLGCNLNTSIELASDAIEPLSIETFPNGQGQEVIDLSLHLNEEFHFHAVERDSKGGFVANQRVNWSVTGNIGSLNILLGGEQAVFTALSSGQGQVIAVFKGRDSVVNINVLPQAPPTALTDLRYVAQDSEIDSIAVLFNDSDPDGDSISLNSYTQPSHGTVTDNGNETFKYVPDPGFRGQDTFSYDVVDDKGNSSTGIVLVNVMLPTTWTGNGSDDHWSTAGNWCGNVLANHSACAGDGAPPSATETAYFDKTCSGSCRSEIHTAINLEGIFIGEGFTGEIHQISDLSKSQSITLNLFGWQQAGGHFYGGDSNINAKYFKVTGGQFRSTSETLNISYVYPVGTYDTTFFEFSENASFEHNSGTVRLAGSKGYCGVSNHRFSLPATGFEFHNLEYNSFSVGCGTTILNPTPNHLVVVKNKFTHISGPLNGNYSIEGDIELGNDASHSNGNGQLTLIGATDQTIISGTGRTETLIINKPSGVVNTSGLLRLTGFKLIQGEFNAPTTLDVIASYNPSYGSAVTLFEIAPSATYNKGSSLLKIGGGKSGCSAVTFTIDVDPSVTFNDVEFYSSDYGCGEATISTAALKPMKVQSLSLMDGYIYGEWEISKNLTIDANSLGGNATLSLVGTTNQNIDHQGGTLPTADFTIDSSSTITLINNNLTFNNAGHSLYFKSGNLIMNGFDFTNIDELHMLGGSFTKTTETLSYGNCIGSCPP